MGELRGRAFWAWVIVCLVWGSTYIAIRVGVQVMPPFLFGGVRFLIAGVLLGLIARARGESFPRKRSDLRTLAITGTLLLAGGNGLVVWAEQYLDSGTASIYVVTVAIWAACFDALIPGGKTRFSWGLVGGLILGVVGMVLLTGTSPSALVHADLRGPLALIVASSCWGFGTVYLKRHPVATPFSMSAAVQMLTGGAVVTVLGLVNGDLARWHTTPAAWTALIYLIIFGSIIGFTAYGYALRFASATTVGTYAYVNPVVAVLLGWAMLHEELSLRKILAMGVILGAVFWIQRAVSSTATTASSASKHSAFPAHSASR